MSSSQTIHVKIDKNVQVHDRTVYLKDFAQISSADKAMENKVKLIRIPNAVSSGVGRHAMSIMEIIPLIHKEYPNADIDNIGEADFIITYEKQKQPGKVVSWGKTILVALIAFFGAAFAIMTFNNDVDVPKLFSQLYEQFTGKPSDGFTILEFSYSLGVGSGILVFFNHFIGKKFTADPTPLEVEMRLYEDEVDKTLIEASRRDPKKKRGKAS